MNHEVVGWSASIVVVLTTVGQIYKQWTSRSSKGVSPWLFVGNLVASTLFLDYAMMIKNTVYMVTNAIMVVASVVGLAILAIHRHVFKPIGHATPVPPRPQ